MKDNRNSLKVLIHNLQTQINDLKYKAAEVETDMQNEYNRRIDDLEHRKLKAEQQLAELEDSSSAATDDITSGVQRAWHEVKDAVSSAVDRFR